MKTTEITIHTDGCCLGNPGKGGFAAVVRRYENGVEIKKRVVSKNAPETTNNRMELMAAITALELLTEGCEVTLFSDSRYLVDAMTKGWLTGWKKKGWRKADKKPVLNRDLWERLDRAVAGHHVTWKWVKGHAGHPLNERCDELVHEAIDAGGLQEDLGYRAQQGGEG